MRTSTFDLHAKAADVDLWKLLRDWRTEVPPVPYDEIAVKLRDYDIHVSRHTVWRWVQERNIDTARPYAPRRKADEIAGESGRGASVPQSVDGGEQAAAASPISTTGGAESGSIPDPPPASPETALERELRQAREAM